MIKFSALLLAIIVLGCTSQKPVYYESNPGGSQTATTSTAQKGKPDNTVYYVLENGNYVQSELDKKPVPVKGTTPYLRISYPAEARNKGIEGTVILAVVVNESGTMEDVQIKKGIGYGCDEEALNAWKKTAQGGFEPAIKNGKAVKVRYDVPVNFRLH